MFQSDMNLSIDEVQQRAEANRREVDPPIPVETATWSKDSSPFPSLLPALLEMRRPELGSRLALGHPQGLALTPARTAPQSPRREQEERATRSRCTRSSQTERSRSSAPDLDAPLRAQRGGPVLGLARWLVRQHHGTIAKHPRLDEPQSSGHGAVAKQPLTATQ
jgi:hypothetical protein